MSESLSHPQNTLTARFRRKTPSGTALQCGVWLAAAPLIGAEKNVIYRGTTNKNDNDTLAIFAELTFDLTESLFLDVGGRWSEDTKKSSKQVLLGVGSPSEQVVVIGTDGVPTGALDGDLDPNTLQDSYVKLNARIALAGGDDSWEVALYGRNLTDEATYTFATDAPLSAGIFAGWVEEPMIVGLQGRYNF